MLKAVIFDLDGLLVDSTPLQWEATKRFLEHFNKLDLSTHSGSEGKRIIDILLELKDVYDLPGTIEELYHIRQEFFLKLVAQKLELFAGALELLEKIKKRGAVISMATSGDKNYVHAVLKKFPKLAEYFKIIVTGDDVVAGKPNPEIYLKTAQTLGVKPFECVVLEDSFNGIISAKRAGMTVVAVPNQNYPDADYSQADQVFSSLVEVLGRFLF